LQRHLMELPSRVLVGEGVLAELGSLLRELDMLRNPLVVSGETIKQRLQTQIQSTLNSSSLANFWITVNSATLDEVMRVEKEANSMSAKLLVGVGGGKSVDVAKLAAFRVGIPYISVPTSASHDGISSPFASIKGLDKPYSFVAKPPSGILADIDLIAAAPHRLLASGCGDLIAKVTAVRDWELAHKVVQEYFGKYAASLAELSAKVVMAVSADLGQGNKNRVRDVVEALISAGVAAGIAGSSRPCSGSEHLFSHALDFVAPGKGLHGEKCGIGTIMMAKLHGIDWDNIRQSLENVDAPTRASEIGARDEEIAEALVRAPSIRPDRYTILNEAKLDRGSALELARATGVI